MLEGRADALRRSERADHVLVGHRGSTPQLCSPARSFRAPSRNPHPPPPPPRALALVGLRSPAAGRLRIFLFFWRGGGFRRAIAALRPRRISSFVDLGLILTGLVGISEGFGSNFGEV
ncbi:hypothetical protein NL676_001509 [Syzygium grande]|nr:hypothetical protein NL676_001509 [Syzygium grande]